MPYLLVSMHDIATCAIIFNVVMSYQVDPVPSRCGPTIKLILCYKLANLNVKQKVTGFHRSHTLELAAAV